MKINENIKIKDLIVIDELYNGTEFKTLGVLAIQNENGKEQEVIYKLGTLKNAKSFNYINCIHKDFKKN